MGAILSCLSCQLCSCITSSLCSCLPTPKMTSSIATRLMYAIIYLLTAILGWLMLTDWAVGKIEKYTLGYLKLTCGDDKENGCYGLVAVHKIMLALALFHVILAALVYDVHNANNKRASVQNSHWLMKIALWLSLIVGCFFLPNQLVIWYSNYPALLGAAVFIFIQLLLLIDLAYKWGEICITNYESSDSEDSSWKYILIGSTLSCLIFYLVMTGLLYNYFSGEGCGFNSFIVTSNLLLALAILFISVHPAVQEENSQSGLTQSSVVIAYCTYLITSAIINAPATDPLNSDVDKCNPINGTMGTRTTSLVVGAMITLVAIVYSTSRAATQSNTLLNGPDTGLLDNDGSAHELRSEAINAAVESGALNSNDLEANQTIQEDEDSNVKYSYTFFHVVFVLASMYGAMLLTNWNALDTHQDGFVMIGKSSAAMWVKIISAWLCFGLYGWSLLAPILLPDRVFV